MSFDNLVTTAILAAGALTYWVVAVIALARLGIKERLGRALGLYGVAAGVWEALLALWTARLLAFWQPEFQARLPLYGVLALAVIGLYLSQAFLRLGGRRLAAWWIGGGLYLALLIGLDSNLVPLGPAWPALRQPVVLSGIALGWGLYAGLTLLLTARAQRNAQSALHRNRIRYWGLWFSLTFCSDILLFIPWLVPAVIPLLVLAVVVRLWTAAGIAYVSLSHRLPDLRRAILQSLSYLFVTVITMLLCLGVFALATYTFVALFQPWAAWTILAAILAIGIVPLRSLAQRVAQRLFIGKNYNSRQMVSDYSVAISNILEMEHLAELTISLINGAMGVRHGALFLVDLNHKEPANYYRLRNVKTVGTDSPGDGRLSADGPLAVYLRQEHTPLTHYDVDLLPRFKDAAPEERAWMNDLKMDVYVPIYAQTEWIGLLALGPKTSGDRYFDDDLLMLSVLADQTAVALKNARLVEDLRQINRTLDDVNRHLAQMDRTKSEFIDVISHELLTPLSLIVGYNQLLLDDRATRTNEPQTRLMQGIQQGAHRMREIIDTMLDVAKIDTSTLQLQSHPISIVAPIQEVAAKLKTALVERKLTLEIRDLSNLPLLETDLEALYKVFYNLIVNAVKYTPDGGRITVSGQALAPGAMPEVPDGGLEVVIADTGIGIDPQHVDLIFAKFYQTGDVIAHSTGKTKFKGGGPGLGLAIVKGIVEAHGGKVWAESLGHDESTCPGSRFHVVLPIRQKHAKAGGNGKGKG